MFLRYQRAMRSVLLHALRNARPDMLVVDRFTFAGVDVAWSLGVPFALNNPSLLFDVDSPPHYVPAPLSAPAARRVPSSLWQRSWNLYRRIVMQSAAAAVAEEARLAAPSPAARVAPQGPASSGAVTTAVLVLINTAFGLEDPRPMPLKMQMVGPLVRSWSDPLPTPLLQWLDAGMDAPAATVFVNLLPGGALTTACLAAVARALVGAGLRILWVAPGHKVRAFDAPSPLPSSQPQPSSPTPNHVPVCPFHPFFLRLVFVHRLTHCQRGYRPHPTTCLCRIGCPKQRLCSTRRCMWACCPAG